MKLFGSYKIPYSIMIIWSVWALAAVPGFFKVIDESEIQIKEGTLIDVQCAHYIRSMDSITFWAKYDNTTTVEKDGFVPLLRDACHNDEFVTRIKGKRIKLQIYEGRNIGVLIEGEVMVDINNTLDGTNHTSIVIFLTILAFTFTLLRLACIRRRMIEKKAIEEQGTSYWRSKRNWRN